MKIERDKAYLTRCGEVVRVVCTDAPGEMPVVALHTDGPYAYTAEGRFLAPDSESAYDLISEAA